ncbi:MAG: hypothetical protein ABIG11_00725 [bacterium]
MKDTAPEAKTHQSARVNELWERLTALCEQLWKDDNPAAVPLQVIIEEFRGELSSLGRLMPEGDKLFKEQVHLVSEKLKKEYEKKSAGLEETIGDYAGREAKMVEELRAKKSRAEELLKALDDREADMENLREKLLRTETEFNSRHAESIREMYEDLNRKEKEMSSFWETMRKSMEEKTRAAEKQHRDRLAHVETREKTMTAEFAAKKTELLRTFEKIRKGLEDRAALLSDKERSMQDREKELDQWERRLKKGINTTRDT